MAEITTRELQIRVGEFLASRQPSGNPSAGALHPVIEVLTRTVRKGWRTYLVGGFLRDVIVRPHSPWPRDFDVIVEGCSWKELREVFIDIIAGQNRFGGLALRQSLPGLHHTRDSAFDFDVWRLEDTWGVKQLSLPHTIEAFVQTPFLNIDSIAISIGSGDDYLAVFEHGFFEALQKKSIDVNQTSNPYPVLCATRGLIMASTLNFAVGSKLANFVYELAENVALDEFVGAQLGHYGHVVSPREQLTRWILDVRTQLEAGYKNVRLTNEATPEEASHHPFE